AKADIKVVSPNAPPVVPQLLEKTRIKFYRTLDEALATLDPTLLKEQIDFIPFGSSTVPIPGFEDL
ncbi:MAG TPA: hypothetical protein VE177_01165, partial [Candidatus Binatus sp.]|nr:hypothetical protein [Candidatus Binatus sp.]